MRRTWGAPGVTDRLGHLLLVTLEAARLDGDLPVLGARRFWLDSWRGIRRCRAWHGAPGLRSPAHALRRARLASDVLHDWDRHSPTSAMGTAWERTPWHATQRAAWGALTKADTLA